MLIVRPAVPTDAAAVSELVLQSDCGMLPALFGPRVGELLEWLLPRRGNPYCASNTLVIADGGGVIGAMVGSLVSAARAADLRTAAQLARWYGPAVICRLPRLARAGGAVRTLAPGDFYLSHIAVLPPHRGRGAGAQLLRGTEDRARLLGAGGVVLDVEEKNEGARAFYARMGYGRGSVVRVDLGRHGCFCFLRLRRDL